MKLPLQGSSFDQFVFDSIKLPFNFKVSKLIVFFIKLFVLYCLSLKERDTAAQCLNIN